MANVLLTIDDAVRILDSGGILLLQTDTLPGLHARADDSIACSRIQKIKGRGEDKPMVVLAANLKQARLICGDLSAQQEVILHKYWPGPFSFILPAGTKACQNVTGELGTVAVRVPALAELRSFIGKVGFPLASSSANLSGEPPCTTLCEAVSLFSEQVDHYLLDDSQKKFKSVSQPSALIDLTTLVAKQLREGPLPFVNL